MQQVPQTLQDCQEEKEEEAMTDVDLWISSWPEWEQRVAEALLQKELSNWHDD